MSIRNIAIIAHVDHGKTTLIDNMLKQSNTFKINQVLVDRIMDSNDLERERGITILSKCASITWNNVRINVIDTPGHSDFSGEVERILSMVDSVLLLVDAVEGVMPQTKFVLLKALKLNLNPIVVINKVDRSNARVDEVLNEVFELFCFLNANEKQLDFPIIYASGREGWATDNLTKSTNNLSILFDYIINYVLSPECNVLHPFSMLVSMRDYDPYLGKILIGKIYSGSIAVNQVVKVLNTDNLLLANSRVSKIFSFKGLNRVSVNTACAGDIVAISGIQNATVSNTICAIDCIKSIPSFPIDPPTLCMIFRINDSPLAGHEGLRLTARTLWDRLVKEINNNVSLHISKYNNDGDVQVSGRGELQFGILIETIRREGFELSISRPKVLFKKSDDGNILEPIEELQIDIDDNFVNLIFKSLNLRKAEMVSINQYSIGKTRIIFHIPSRGLIGYNSQFLSETRGTGIMHRAFYDYDNHKGFIPGRRNGVLVSMVDGLSVSYALYHLEQRGKIFIQPNTLVYEGMIIGEHSRDSDLDVNPLKSKQLSNVRSVCKDESIQLTPICKMTLEESMSYIQDDEILEITPKSIRLRKIILSSSLRKRNKV